MSDLNDLVSSAQDEVIERQTRVRQKTPKRTNPKVIKAVQLLLAILVVIFCLSQFMKVLPWIFGVPAGITRDNIVILLNQAHDEIEQVRETTGTIPEELPADLPAWLIEYKKQDNGYTIDATIDNVTVELIQEGNKTTIKKHTY